MKKGLFFPPPYCYCVILFFPYCVQRHPADADAFH